MLIELIVERTMPWWSRLAFGLEKGLNVLTGETGSRQIHCGGFVGALARGARLGRDDSERRGEGSRLGNLFGGQDAGGREALLASTGIEHGYDEELIVEREIAANGKSRAFVANRPVTTAFLRQLAPALGDIHGQDDQQVLFSAQGTWMEAE